MASHSAGHSGTGVFYQAMPAVGADGRNVMKLIPVQKVNGQFVPSKISPRKKDVPEPPRAVTLNFASKPVVRSVPAFQSADIEQFVKTQLSAINGVPHLGRVAGRGPEIVTLQKKDLQSPMQSQASLTASRGAQGALQSTPTSKNGTLFTLLGSGQLPVTVKSPVLPSGQYLQIPPTAQVKTLPMSALPPAIKRQIVTSTANAASNSKLPTVLYVSPVQTMNEGGPQPRLTAAPFPKRPQKTSDQTPSASSSVPSTQSTRSVAKDSQKPVTPMRWVIEEQDGLPAPCLVPVNSSSMMSNIIKTLSEMEKAQSTAKKPQVPQASLTKTDQGAQNALVMCNGKVYFVANKAKPSESIGNVTSTVGSPGSSQRVSASSLMPTNASVESQLSHKDLPQSDFIVIPDGPDEVIDLCDDDSQDDLPLHAISIPEKTRSRKTQPEAEDEDSNVIFVSYIPPKSSELSGAELEKAPVNNLKARLEIVSENIVDEQILVGTQGSVTDLSKEGRQDIDKTQDMASSRVSATYPEVICQTEITDQGRGTNHSKVSGMEMEGSHIASTSLGVDISLVTSKETVPSQHVFTLELVNHQTVLHDQGTEKRLHNITSKDMVESTQRHTQVQKTQQIQNLLDPTPVSRTSVDEQDSSKMCDHLLKRMFGITSDVKIHLERVDAKKPENTPGELPQIEPSAKHILKSISELIQVSKITVKKRGHQEMQVCLEGTNEISPKDGKKMKMENASTASEGSENMDESLISPSPQPETGFLNTSVSSENAKESLGCSTDRDFVPPTEFCAAEAEQIFGLEEPVDDFLSTTAESEIRALPPSLLDSPHIPKLRTAKDAKDCSVEVCSAASNNLETKPKRRRGRSRKCLACPNGTHEDMPVSSPAIAQEKSCSSKTPDCSLSTIPEPSEQSGVSTKEQREDYKLGSVEIQCLSSLNEQSSLTARDIFCTSPMDPEEIKRHEKIRRLKELLREKEAALDIMRKKMT